MFENIKLFTLIVFIIVIKGEIFNIDRLEDIIFLGPNVNPNNLVANHQNIYTSLSFEGAKVRVWKRSNNQNSQPSNYVTFGMDKFEVFMNDKFTHESIYDLNKTFNNQFNPLWFYVQGQDNYQINSVLRSNRLYGDAVVSVDRKRSAHNFGKVDVEVNIMKNHGEYVLGDGQEALNLKEGDIYINFTLNKWIIDQNNHYISVTFYVEGNETAWEYMSNAKIYGAGMRGFNIGNAHIVLTKTLLIDYMPSYILNYIYQTKYNLKSFFRIDIPLNDKQICYGGILIRLL